MEGEGGRGRVKEIEILERIVGRVEKGIIYVGKGGVRRNGMRN